MVEEENETLFIRVWKPFLSKRVLKFEGNSERKSPKKTISPSSRLLLLQMVTESDTELCASEEASPQKRVDMKRCAGRWAPKGVDLVWVPYRLEKETSGYSPSGRLWLLQMVTESDTELCASEEASPQRRVDMKRCARRWAPKGVDLVWVPYRLEKETSGYSPSGRLWLLQMVTESDTELCASEEASPQRRVDMKRCARRWASKGVDLVWVPYRLEKETSASEDVGP